MRAPTSVTGSAHRRCTALLDPSCNECIDGLDRSRVHGRRLELRQHLLPEAVRALGGGTAAGLVLEVRDQFGVIRGSTVSCCARVPRGATPVGLTGIRSGAR